MLSMTTMFLLHMIGMRWCDIPTRGSRVFMC